MKTYGFFLDKNQREQFVTNYLHSEVTGETDSKAKHFLKPGIAAVKFKESQNGIPGLWLQIHFEDHDQGRKIQEEIKDLFSKIEIPTEVFYPKSPMEKKELEKKWQQKYGLSSSETSEDRWKIFYKEIKSHFDKDRIQQAYVGLNMILRQHPEFLKRYKRYGLYEDIAMHYEEAGEMKRAEEAIKKPLFLNIESDEPYLNLSAFYMLHGMEEKAYKVGKFALKRFPDNIFVICNHAVILSTLEYYEKALEILTEAEKKGITDPLLYKTKGELLADLEKDEEAIRTLKKGLKHMKKKNGPLRSEILSALAESYINLEDYEKAAMTYEKIYKEDRRDIYHLLRLVGTNFYELENYDKALKYAELLLEADPGMSSYHYLLGLIRMERNDLDLAQWHLYKAKQLMPGHPLVDEELREVKLRKRKKVGRETE